MKRYLLFAGATYYASGGVRDLVSSHDKAGDAVAEGVRLCNDSNCSPSVEWWHVLDIVTGEIVETSEYSSYGEIGEHSTLGKSAFEHFPKAME